MINVNQKKITINKSLTAIPRCKTIHEIVGKKNQRKKTMARLELTKDKSNTLVKGYCYAKITPLSEKNTATKDI